MLIEHKASTVLLTKPCSGRDRPIQPYDDKSQPGARQVWETMDHYGRPKQAPPQAGHVLHDWHTAHSTVWNTASKTHCPAG